MVQLYADLGSKLLQYKNANGIVRHAMLLDAMVEIDRLSDKVDNKEDAKKHYKQLAYAATLINYADVLRRMENQEFFDVLFDFYNMELGEELREWFEFGGPGQMRLKHPIHFYTPDIWNKFRIAQKAHLIKCSKEHLFDLDQLDILNPPKSQLYPIQIQMLGKLENEAVDRISVDSQGRIRFAKRFGLYLLPGGGMVEISNSTKIDELKRKMLEEHLEEEHANLYIKAAELYDQLDVGEFNNTLLEVFIGKQAQSLSSDFQMWLNQQAVLDAPNSVRLTNIVRAIDGQIAILKAEEPSTTEEQARKQRMLKSFVELRAIVQVQTFALTPLFEEAFRYVKENTKQVDIKQFLDTRALGGSQLSHSFIMTGMPLEDWFKAKFNGAEGEFGDDIAGSDIERLTLLEALEQFRKIKFSHVLIGLANYEQSLNNETLRVEHAWDVDKFNAARTTMLREAASLLLPQQEFAPEIYKALQHAIGQLKDKGTQVAIIEEWEEFNTKLSSVKNLKELHDEYDLFANNCRKLLDNKDSNILNTILTIAAASVATVLAGGIGFGIGFALGLWTGPGAFYTALMAGSAAASATLAATGMVGMTTGVLAGYSLFKQTPEIAAVKQVLNEVDETLDKIESLTR